MISLTVSLLRLLPSIDSRVFVPIMEKEPQRGDSSPDNDHLERLPTVNPYGDHRAEDDRADEAKGRDATKFDKSYWLSVNYIGTLFAVGMAFMGGIGGEEHLGRARVSAHRAEKGTVLSLRSCNKSTRKSVLTRTYTPRG